MPAPSPDHLTTPNAAPSTQPSVAPAFAPQPASPSEAAERGSWWRGLSPLGRWGVGGTAVVLGLAVVAGGVASGMYISWRGANRIAPNVSIQGVPVGGMTALQAKAALKKKYGALTVRFETPEKVYTQSLAQMGGRVTIDQAVRNAFWLGRAGSLPANAIAVYKARSQPTAIPLALRWDKRALRQRMALISGQYGQEATDARLQFAGSDLIIVPDAPGRAINAGATLASLQKSYKIGSERIAATVVPVPARVQASALTGRNVLLGRYSTSFDSGLWGRTRNLHVAAATIDGMVMMPGEKFSFNQRTGERTWDKGYRMGHIFEDRGKGAEVVDGLAGGVCQVSSTVFNAIRKTNNKLPSKVFLRINERNHHSLPVTYVPSGLDATVAWPHKDFRFTNSLTHPIFLRAVISGGTLSVSVWGRIPEGVPAYTTQLAQVSTVTS